MDDYRPIESAGSEKRLYPIHPQLDKLIIDMFAGNKKLDDALHAADIHTEVQVRLNDLLFAIVSFDTDDDAPNVLSIHFRLVGTRGFVLNWIEGDEDNLHPVGGVVPRSIELPEWLKLFTLAFEELSKIYTTEEV